MNHLRGLWENLPVQTLETTLAGRCPLVLAPHPDDESLGCGGLLAQCSAAGIPAQVAILTDGSHSHPGSASYPPPRLASVRHEEARAALAILGLPETSLFWIGAEDTRLPATGTEAEAIIAWLSAICEETGCTLLFAPWRHDPHCDHEASNILAATLAERTGLALMNYPVWGWTLPDSHDAPPPQAGFRLDITQQLPLKEKAIRAHATQYGGVVTDAPDGFALPEELLSVFRRPYETFLVP
ncbi:MAG TPA: PIG-L deacetylase family protein [Acidisoma sp.]|nr:PIG-L deacetylase family protein [Acidisoma sp.]